MSSSPFMGQAGALRTILEAEYLPQRSDTPSLASMRERHTMALLMTVVGRHASRLRLRGRDVPLRASHSLFSLALLLGGCSRAVLWPAGDRGASLRCDTSPTDSSYTATLWREYGNPLVFRPFNLDWHFVSLARDEVEVSVDGAGHVDGRARKLIGLGDPSAVDTLVLGIELQGGDNQDGEGWSGTCGAACFVVKASFERIDRSALRRDRWVVGLDAPMIFIGWLSAGGMWADSPDGSWTGDEGGWYLDLFLYISDSDIDWVHSGHSFGPEEGEARGAPPASRRVALRFMHDSMEGTAFEIHWIVPKTTLKVGYADMRWGDGLRLGIDWRF